MIGPNLLTKDARITTNFTTASSSSNDEYEKFNISRFNSNFSNRKRKGKGEYE